MAVIYTYKSKNNKGFTLVELSIVLVIIGLIVGGVLIGRDLIRAAEIRAIYIQKEEIITAINTFKLKYNAFLVICPMLPAILALTRRDVLHQQQSPQTNQTRAECCL